MVVPPSLEAPGPRHKGLVLMQSALVLIITGVLLGMPTAIFAYSNPRREGEPLGAQRKALLGLSALGMAGVLVGAAAFFTAER